MHSVTSTGLDVQAIRERFPILHQEVNGKPLIYLDNAATSQKPDVVLDALNRYYQKDNSNIHRGIHTLAERATQAFEETRKLAARFINAREAEEVIFTRGTTESTNLVASSWGRKYLKAGDEVLISAMEHHSNIVPWQLICQEKEATLKVIPVSEKGEILLDELDHLLSEKTKLVAVVHASNTLGTINPIAEIIEKAHNVGAKVLIDGAQASPHLDIDVQKLNCDFYALSAHKMYGPTGTGILYGKRQVLESMPPYMGGGEMIKDVSFSGTTYNDIPYKFEAGTPNIGDVIAFGKAIEFISDLGKSKMAAHENELLAYGNERLQEIDGFIPVGTADNKVSVISFMIDGVHHFDLGMMLDAKGIAVRTGHHCTQPLMDFYKIDGTARASFAVYNTKDEIDTLAESLKAIVSRMRK
ncbi:MAG: cysteine desulfurase [Bacteroidota bacterium]